MQAFFAAKSEIFFFFSEGAPPKLCPLLAAEMSRPEHSPMRSFRPREAALPLRKNFGKLFLFL